MCFPSQNHFLKWPKVCGHYNIIPICDCWIKPQALTCVYNSLHSSGVRLSTRCWMLATGICSHSAKRALVRSNDVGWCTVGVPVHPKDVGWAYGQAYVQTSPVLPQQTGKIISLWSWLCAVTLKQDRVKLLLQSWKL